MQRSKWPGSLCLSGISPSEQAGIAFDPALTRHGEMTEALGLVSTVEMFRQGDRPPTAIICSHVHIAKGVYKALEALGLGIPGDVSVMAHDDHLPALRASAFFPALSVTKAPLRDSWEPLADCLAGLLEGRPLKELQRVGPHELIIRNSTGPAPEPVRHQDIVPRDERDPQTQD